MKALVSDAASRQFDAYLHDLLESVQNASPAPSVHNVPLIDPEVRLQEARGDALEKVVEHMWLRGALQSFCSGFKCHRQLAHRRSQQLAELRICYITLAVIQRWGRTRRKQQWSKLQLLYITLAVLERWRWRARHVRSYGHNVLQRWLRFTDMAFEHLLVAERFYQYLAPIATFVQSRAEMLHVVAMMELRMQLQKAWWRMYSHIHEQVFYVGQPSIIGYNTDAFLVLDHLLDLH